MNTFCIKSNMKVMYMLPATLKIKQESRYPFIHTFAAYIFQTETTTLTPFFRLNAYCKSER